MNFIHVNDTSRRLNLPVPNVLALIRNGTLSGVWLGGEWWIPESCLTIARGMAARWAMVQSPAVPVTDVGELLTVQEAAKRLGVPVSTLYQRLTYGRVEVCRFGHRVRVSSKEIERILGQQEASLEAVVRATDAPHRKTDEDRSRDLYTVWEAAVALTMPSSSVYRAIRIGVLPAVRFSGQWRIPRSSLDHFRRTYRAEKRHVRYRVVPIATPNDLIEPFASAFPSTRSAGDALPNGRTRTTKETRNPDGTRTQSVARPPLVGPSTREAAPSPHLYAPAS